MNVIDGWNLLPFLVFMVAVSLNTKMVNIETDYCSSCDCKPTSLNLELGKFDSV